ncbi:MAG: glycosyltransferase [Deltaproteobacteria bacterium]|nr:glycosyltransferase [Deltaproteobacteria bacterium]
MHASRPLNIAMLSIHSSPLGELGTIHTGGMSIYIRELAFELASLGHTIDIFTCAGTNGHEPVVQLAQNVRLIHFPIPEADLSSHRNLLPLLPHIFRILEEYTAKEKLRYDIAHSHYWLSGCLGSLIQEKWHIPHVIMFHTLGLMKNPTDPGEREARQRVSQEKKLVMQSQKIIAPTHQEKKNLIDLYNTSSDKNNIIPGSVNLDLFQISRRQDARKAIHIDFDEPLLLFVGRFAVEKGITLLFEAIQLLHKKMSVQLMIIGGDGNHDPRKRDLVDRAVQLHIEKQVHFAGRVDHQQLSLYYNAADLVVMPSRYESFGLVCLEALACGTPVVSTNVGIMPSILDGETNGATISDASPRSLATAIENFFSNKRSPAFDSQQIRQTVVKFSWQHVATETLLAYDELLSDDISIS